MNLLLEQNFACGGSVDMVISMVLVCCFWWRLLQFALYLFIRLLQFATNTGWVIGGVMNRFLNPIKISDSWE